MKIGQVKNKNSFSKHGDKKMLKLRATIIIAVMISVIIIPMVMARYLLGWGSKADLTFYEYVVKSEEILISPTTYTGEGDDVSISIAGNHFTQEQLNDAGLRVQYKKAGDSSWTDYVYGTTFKVTDNTTITARFVADNFEGPTTEKKIENIAVAKIPSGNGEYVYYKTLEQAIDAVGDTKATIIMVADTKEHVTVPANKDIVLDLAGFKVIGQDIQEHEGVETTSSSTAIVVNGKLNIIDSGKTEGNTTTYGELTVKDSNSNTSPAAIKVESTGMLTLGLDDGNVNANAPVIRGGKNGIEVAENGKFNFYDGMVIGKIQAINSHDVNEENTLNDVVNTPDTWVVDVTVKEETGEEVATLVKTYQVEFDTNGGTPIPQSISVLFGKPYGKLPEDISKTGYTLIGWKNGDAPVSSSTIVSQSDNHTLTADWKEHTYTLKYDANSGYGTIEDTDYKYSEEVIIADPSDKITKAGYTFKGWNTKGSGDGETYQPYDKVKELTKIDGAEVTLYANWKDETKPNTTAPGGTSTTKTIVVEFKQQDDGSGIDYETVEYAIKKDLNGDGRIDDDEWSDWQKSDTFTDLVADTEYEIKTRASDVDGNGPQESEVGTVNTNKIENGTIEIYRASNPDSEEGKVQPKDNPNTKTDPINEDIKIKVDPSDNGSTTVTVKKYPDGDTSEYPNGTVTPDESGNYEINVPTETGVYEITVETTDGTNTVTETVYVVVDKTNPEVAPELEQTSNSINVDAKAQDTDSGIEKITYTLKDKDGNPAKDKDGNEIEPIVVDGNENQEIEFTNLPDNTEFKVEIEVEDKAGNKTTKEELAKTDDLMPGNLTFKEATSQEDFSPNENVVPVGVENKVWKNEDVVITPHNGNTGVTTYTIKKDNDGEEDVQGPYSTVKNLTTTDGDYIVTLTTTDGVNTETVTYYFSIDKTRPTVQIDPNGQELSIAVGDINANIQTQLTAVDNENGSGIITTKYGISTSSENEPQTWVNFASGETITQTKPGGVYYVWSNVEDRAGNKAVSIKVSNKFDIGYLVEYDKNTGLAEDETIKVKRKTSAEDISLLIDEPTRPMYLFKGWSENKDATQIQYANDAIYKQDKSIRLYAVWSEVVASTTIDGVTTNYDSVQEAITQAGNNKGAIVTLIKSNIDESVTVAEGQEIILDTAGKILTSTDSSNTLVNRGNLTIIGNGTITTDPNKEFETIDNIGTLKLENVSVTSNNGYAVKNEDNATTEIMGSTIKSVGSNAIQNCGTGTVKINSGNIEAGNTAITNESNGNITILDGFIKGKNGIKAKDGVNGTINITGGKIVATDGYGINGASSTVNVSGNQTEIKGTLAGVLLTSGNLNLAGGTVDGTEQYGIHVVTGEGKVNVGEDDGSVSIEKPVIIGKTAGLYTATNNSIINFYDGIIKVPENAMAKNREVTDTPDGYRLIEGENEIIGENTYKTEHLDNHYVITFNYNGATSGNTEIGKTVEYGKKYEDLPIPEKTGYSFSGWYINETNITSETLVQTAENHTLDARWMANSNTPYTVKHYLQNANDDKYALVQTDNLTGSTGSLLVLSDLTKQNTENIPSCDVEKITLNEGITSQADTTTTVDPNGSTVIYIYYNRKTFELSVEDGMNTKNPQGSGTYRWGQNVEISAEYKNEEGYTYSNFKWIATSNSIGVENSSLPATTVIMPMQHVLLTAIAEKTPIRYSITYDLNGGEFPEGIEVPGEYTVENKVDLPEPEKTGNYFVGWKEEGTDDSTATNEIPQGTTGDKKLIAVYSNGESLFTVHHYLENANNNDYTEYRAEVIEVYKGTDIQVKTNDVITLDDTLKIDIPNAIYEKSTDTLGGNQGTTVVVTPDKSTQIYVYYKRATFKLNVVSGENTKSAVGTGTYKYGESVDISAEYENIPGYEYTSYRWITADNSIIESITDKTTTITMPAEETTITATAVKSLVEYSITYNLEGGEAEGQNPNSYTTESNDIRLINPTRAGYTFAGWVGTDVPEPNKNVVINKGSYGNKIYTATWSINKYNVTYDYGSNGGQISQLNTEKVSVEEVDYNSDVNLQKTAFKANYTLVGWNTDKDAKTALTTLKMGTSDVILYAIYSKQVTIVYDKNGGDYDITNEYTMFNTDTHLEITTPSSTEYDGWLFNGYAKNNSATSGLAINSKENITIEPDETGKMYYHTWKKNVLFDGNKPEKAEDSFQVTLNEQSRIVYYNNNFGTLPADPTIRGWKFDGWYTQPDGGTLITNETKAQDVPQKVYAHWSLTATMDVAPQSVVLDLSNNKNQQITVTGSDYGDLEYKSDDESYVTVDENGVITAHKNTDNPVIVTVIGSNGELIKTISVEVKTSPTSITISPDTAVVGVNKDNTTQLAYALHATDDMGEEIPVNTNDKVTWQSSDSNIATVDSETGLVTGKANGTVTVTAVTENGCISEVPVTIIVDNESPKISVSVDNTYYKKSHTATITVSDEIAGLEAVQTINYAWSKDDLIVPTEWQSIDLITTQGAKNASVDVTKSDESGDYYLWVKAGLKDKFDNVTTENYVDGNAKAYMDNTLPVIEMNGNANLSTANSTSLIVIPLKIKDVHSGVNTNDSEDAFTAADIVVKVNNEEVYPTTKELTFVREDNGIYSYSLRLSGVEGYGELTLEIASGNVKDKATNPNEFTFVDTNVEMDTSAFTCTIEADKPSPTNASEITYTFKFNKDVKEGTFTQDDIDVTNGTITSFTKESNSTYKITVTNNGTCIQKIDVKTGSCEDEAENTLQDVAELSVEIDRSAPTPVEVTVKAGDIVKGMVPNTQLPDVYEGTVFTSKIQNVLQFSANDLDSFVVGYKVSTNPDANFDDLDIIQSLDIEANALGTTYYVKAVDEAGNQSTVATKVTVKLVSIDVDPKNVTVQNEKTMQLTVTEENAGEVIWSSSDESVATVSQDGVVTAKKVGTAYITAMASNDNTAKDISHVTVAKGIVEIPVAVTGLVYSAENQVGVEPNDLYYTLTGNVQSNAGQYTATAKLKDPANYQWSDGKTTDKTINWKIDQKEVTVSVTADNKNYDGTTNVYNVVYSIEGIVTGDSVTATGVAEYVSGTVGENKTINVTQIALQGEQSSNYKANKTATTMSNINKAPLVIKYIGQTIIYGEEPDLSMDKINIVGFVNSENVSNAEGLVLPTIVANNRNVGEHTITPAGASAINYDISYESGVLKILAKDLSDSDIQANLLQTKYTYNGNENRPDVVVTDNGKQLLENTDYVVEYKDNKDAGNATVTITGIGNYSGTIIKEFIIEKAILTATYTGDDIVYKKQEPSLNVEVVGFVNGETPQALALNGDYKAPIVVNTNVDVNSYTLYPSGGEAKNYSFDYKSGTLNISSPAVGDITVALTPIVFNYDGTAKIPTVDVFDESDKLVEGTDYTVELKNNINVGDATATINLIGNYSGTINKTYKIQKIDMNGNVSISGWKYGEVASTPTATITTETAKNYEITYSYSGITSSNISYGPSEIAPTQAGTYKVTATVVDTDGNHNNLVMYCDFTIEKATLTVFGTANDKNYDGTTNGSGTILLQGAKYEDAPTATATFTFTSADSNNNTPQVVNITEITLEEGFRANYVLDVTSAQTMATIKTIPGVINKLEIENYTYGDTPTEPSIQSDTNDVTQVIYNYSGVTASGETYGPASIQPTEAGNYTLTATLPANENYNEVSETIEFNVNKRAVTAVLSIADKIYDGTVAMQINQQYLNNVVNNDDVNLQIETAPVYPSKNVGNYEIEIQNLALTGTKAQNYELSQTSKLLQSKITKKQLTATYEGETITYSQIPDLNKISVTGFVQGESDINAQGYVAPVVENTKTDVGEYILIPSGGMATNYSFEYVAGKLIINHKPVTSSDITASLDQTVFTYDGTEKEPGVTVCDGSTELTIGKDYSVTYSDNVNAGTATVTIQGMGNYSGTKILTFTINKVLLGIGAISDVKQYDGSTAVSGTVWLNGAVNNEIPTIKNGYSFEFDNANAGENKNVYISGIELDDTFKNNYEISSSSYMLTNGEIRKALLTATYLGEIVEYGTNPSLQIEYSGFVNNEDESVLTQKPTVQNLHTEIGTYLLEPNGGESVNYNFKYVPGTLKIVAKMADVSVTLNPDQYVYDGTEKEPAVTVIDNQTGDTLTKGTDYNVNYINNINAGKATAIIEMIGVFEGEASKDFTINKASLDATLRADGYTYGEVATTPELVITPDNINSLEITYVYSGETNSGTSYGPTTSAPTQAGEYTVTATIVDTNGNYEDLIKTADFVVSKLEVEVPTANSDLVYTGKSQIGVTKDDSNYSVSGNIGTNAGNYVATVSLGNTDNFKWIGLEDGVKTISVPWTIGKVTLDPVAEAEGKVYDGTTIVTSGKITLLNAVNNEVPTATADFVFESPEVGTQNVNAYNIVLTENWDINYKLSTTTAITTAEITKKAMLVDQTLSYSGIYDGNLHSIVVNVTEPVEAGTDYEVYYATSQLSSDNYDTVGTTTPITRKDAGTTTVYYYIKDKTGNYDDYSSNLNENNGVITIDKAELTPAIKNILSKEYDGTTTAQGEISLSGAVNNENPTATATFVFDNKDAGTGKTVNVTNVALTQEYQTNYKLTKTDLTSTSGIITQKTLIATFKANDKCYDGTIAATGSIKLLGVIDGDEVSAVAASITFDNKNAGARFVTAKNLTLSGVDSYNYTLQPAQASAMTASAEIEQVTLTVNELTAYDKTYDGETITNGTVELSGAVRGENPTATATFNFENKNYGVNKNVNVTNITLDSTWSTNYKLTQTTGITKANITKKMLTATYVSETIRYGETPNYEVEVTGFVEGENENTEGYSAPTITPIQNLQVSGSPYTITPSAGMAINYSFTYVSGKLTVVPDNTKTPVITVNPNTYVYDGTKKEPAVTVVYDGTNLVKDTDYIVTYSNNINVGTATATVTLIGNYEGTGVKNYTITKAPGEAYVTMGGWTYGQTPKNPISSSSTNGTGNVTYEYYTNEECTTKTSASDGASVVGGKPSNAGTYYVKATYPATQNYNQAIATAEFSISQKQISIVSASVNQKTYDRTTRATGNIVLQDGVNNEKPNATGVFTFDTKDAGTGKTVVISNIKLGDGFARNYVLSSNEYVLTNGVINKANLYATYQSEQITYGNKPSLTVKVTGFIANETAEDYVAPTVIQTNTNVGSYTLTPSNGQARNYNFVYVSGVLKIWEKSLGSAEITMTISPTEFTYDGTAKTPNVVVVDGYKTLTEGIDYRLEYGNNVNAGNADVSIWGIGNYKDICMEDFTINKADMSVTKTNYSGTYNKQPHKITLSNISDDDVTIYYSTSKALTSSNYIIDGTTVEPTRTNAGSTTVYYYIKDNTGNYKDYSSSEKSNNGVIKVNQKTLTPVVQANNKTYDGTTSATGSISLTGKESGDTVTASASKYVFSRKRCRKWNNGYS